MSNKIVHMTLNLNPFNHRTRIHRMARSLSNIGYEVKVICLQNRKHDLPSVEKSDGFEIVRINLCTRRLPAILHIIKYLEFGLKSLYTIIKFKPKIIHCHDFVTLPIGIILRTKMNVIYDSHELEMHRVGIGRYRSVLVGMFEKLFLKRISAIITVNEEIADILSKRYNVKVYSIYNAYSTEDAVKDYNHSIRSAINAKDDQFLVIYPGVLSYNRGMFHIVNAVPLLHDNICIVMIGYGEIKEKLREVVVKRGLEDRVYILDAVPFKILIQYIATSNVGIMPTLNSSLSYRLGLGNKFFQYIAAGIPVGVSDQPVKKRMVEKYDIGVVFNPEEPEDIADKLNRLLSNRNLYEKFKENSRKAQEELCWENEEKKLFKLYENLTKHSEKGL